MDTPNIKISFLLNTSNTFTIETNSNYAEIAGLYNSNYFFASLSFEVVSSSISNLIVKVITLITDIDDSNNPNNPNNSNNSTDLINFDIEDNYSNVKLNFPEQEIYEKISLMFNSISSSNNTFTLKNEHFDHLLIKIIPNINTESNVKFVKYINVNESNESDTSHTSKSVKKIIIPKIKSKSKNKTKKKSPEQIDILKQSSWALSLMFTMHIFQNKIYKSKK